MRNKIVTKVSDRDVMFDLGYKYKRRYPRTVDCGFLKTVYTSKPRRSLHRRLSARSLIPLAWSSFIRFHPAHIFCPGILEFGIVVPWDKRRKNSKAFFKKMKIDIFRAIYSFLVVFFLFVFVLATGHSIRHTILFFGM